MSARRDFFLHLLPVALLLAVSTSVLSQEAKTVLGPRNVNLYEGANALLAGDGEEGVRLTLLGLQSAQGNRDTKAAHANLCAGYLMIDQPDEALRHCNWVLERDKSHWKTYNNRALVYLRLERFEESEEDIRKGQALKPGSTKLKIVKGMYLDETEPVTPNVEIDDRRSATEEWPEERADDDSN